MLNDPKMRNILLYGRKFFLRSNGSQNIIIVNEYPYIIDDVTFGLIEHISDAVQEGNNTKESIMKYSEKYEESDRIGLLFDDLIGLLYDSRWIPHSHLFPRRRLSSNRTFNELMDYVNADYPLRAMLAVTYRCNNRCSFCYAESPRCDEELLSRDWKKIIDKLILVGVSTFIFTGGEPVLYGNLLDLVKYSSGRVGVGIVTNGTLLTSKYCHGLLDSGLDFMKITLHSHIPGIHDMIVGQSGASALTLDGIKNMIGVGGGRFGVMINTTIMKENYKSIPDMMKILSSLGIRGITLSGLMSRTNNLVLSDEELNDYVDELMEVSKDFNITLSWFGPMCWLGFKVKNPLFIEAVSAGYNRCMASREIINVEPNGDVTPCQSWIHGDKGGNLLTDDWTKIWTSDVMMMARGSHVVAKCHDCEFKISCDGACPLLMTDELRDFSALKEK